MENLKGMANIFGIKKAHIIEECLRMVWDMGMGFGFKMEVDIKENI